MNSSREKEIIKQVQAGNAQAFEPIVHHYQSAVFRILSNLVGGAIVEDLAQDVFLSAFAQIRRFDPQKGSFRSWLYAIARNRALNVRRKKRETLLPEPPEMVQTRTAMDDMMVKEVFRHLDAVLKAMPFQDRGIFVWAELEGLSYAEIARIENLVLIAVAVGYPSNMSGTIREHLLQAFKIPSTSMAPGILPGDRIFLNKAVYGIHPPQRGDVVVFIYPDDRRLYFIKRLVALPGDSIEIKNNNVWINDQPLQYSTTYPKEINFNAKKGTSYLEEQNHRQSYPIMIEANEIDNMAKITVPHGHCFVLGDNRANSRDSRHFGPIPLADVKGRVDYIYWPTLNWSRFGKVGEASILKK